MYNVYVIYKGIEQMFKKGYTYVYRYMLYNVIPFYG